MQTLGTFRLYSGARSSAATVAPAEARGHSESRPRLLLSLALITVLVAIRFLSLEADTPSFLTSDFGPYLDEGYKTSAPRNQLLFGDPRPHPDDPYQGWTEESPLTQALYLYSFTLGGIRPQSARAVTIACYGLFLAMCAVGLGRRYPADLFAAALVLLGLESTVFFFSRIALFEIPLMLFIYAPIFALARYPRISPTVAAALVSVVGIAGAWLVKKSTILYVGPVVFSLMALAVSRLTPKARYLFALVAAVLCAPIAGFLYINQYVFADRLDFAPSSIAEGLLINPLSLVSIAFVFSGLMCLLDLLARNYRFYINDLYRLCLASIVLGGPLFLSLFSYRPLRYYVPLIPAYILLAVEWYAVSRRKRPPVRNELKWQRLVSAPLSFLAFFALSQYCLEGLGLRRIFSETTPFRWVGLILAIALAMTFVRLWSAKPALPILNFVIPAVCIGGLLQSGFRIADFLNSPVHQAQHVRRALDDLIRPNQSLAGNAAPFFAMAGKYRTFYLRKNEPDVAAYLQQFKPDYLLRWDAAVFRNVRSDISKTSQVSIGPMVYRSEYSGQPVELYRLEYPRPDDTHYSTTH